MNLWLRLLLLMLRLRRASPVDLLDELVLDLRVLPNDLDAFGHMNNGRYLTMMDLGRLALMERTGLLKAARRERWLPLVRGIEIEYFRPLMPWQKFRLYTRLISWDRKWVYLEQRFVAGETLHARAHIRGLLRAADGNVPTATLLQAIGAADLEPPEQPPEDVRDPGVQTTAV